MSWFPKMDVVTLSYIFMAKAVMQEKQSTIIVYFPKWMWWDLIIRQLHHGIAKMNFRDTLQT